MMKKFSVVAYLLCILLLSLHTQAQQPATTLTFDSPSAGGTVVLPNGWAQVELPTGCTGTVTFSLDGNVVGASAVSYGRAGIDGSSWPTGAHNLTANYSGDATCAPGSNSVAFTVVKDTPSLQLQTSADSIPSNQDLVVGVSVSNAQENRDGGCFETTGGTVTLLANGTMIATRALSPYAWFTIPAGTLPPGAQNITANYNGSSYCSPGTASAAITVTDFRTVPPPVLLSSSTNPGSDSSPISFTAQVLGDTPASTGNVQLKEGETVLGSSALAPASAQNLLGPLVMEPFVGEDDNYALPYGGFNSGAYLQFKAGSAPDGSNSALFMSGYDLSVFGLQTEYCAPGALHQFSIFAKESTSGQQFRLHAQFFGDTAYDPASEVVSDWFTTSSSWQQFSVSATAPAGIGYCVMEIELPEADYSDALYLWGPQIQWGAAVGPYARGYLFGLQEDDTRNANVANISATLSAGTHNLLATYSGDSNYGSGSSAQLVQVVNSGVPVVPLAIATSSMPAGVQNNSYGATLIPGGGVAPYTWSVISGSLPAGLLLDAQRGVIAGTPTTVGTSTFIVKVSDANANTATAQLSLNITAPLVITTAYLPSVSQNVPYAAQLAASGGQTPYTWALLSGSLPAGLQLNSSTGEITGTPTTGATGTSGLGIQVTDANSNSTIKSFVLPLNVRTAIPYMTSLAAGGSNGTFTIGAACPHGNGLTAADVWGDGCLASDANLGGQVEDTVVDQNGNIYLVSSVSLNGSTFVRKIDATTGVITRFAGGSALGTSCSSPDLSVNAGGNPLGDGCPAISGWFEGSRSLAVDTNYLYIGDGSASKIHRVGLSDYPMPGRPYAHELELVAGVGTTSSGNATGPQATTVISVPRGIAVDGHGNVFWGNASGIYMVDYSANPPQVRAVTSGRQGCQTSGQLTVAPATGALVNEPNSLTFDRDGNLYFVDKGCYSVRKITPNPSTGVVDGTGTFSTLVGNGVQGTSGGSWYNTWGTPAYIATLRGITTASLDPITWHPNSRNLYISTTNGLWFYDASSGWAHQIMKTSGTLGCAANQTSPYTGCPAPNATFSASSGGGRLSVDQHGNLYIADYGNNQITKLSIGTDFAGTAPVTVPQSAVTQTAVIHGLGTCPANTPMISVGPDSSTFSLGTSTCNHYSAGDQGIDWVIPITFTPTQPGYQTGSLVVEGTSITLDGYGKASPNTPVLTWNTPAAISYGTPLSAAQLNAMASVPGSFVYSPSAGTVLNAGTPALSVTFTPTDSVNYTTVSKTIPLAINKALLTVTANDISIPYGSPIPTFTASYSGFVNGDTLSALLGTPFLTTTATQTSPAGSYAISAALGTLSAGNYTFGFQNGTLTITTPPPAITSLSLTQGPPQVGFVIYGNNFGSGGEVWLGSTTKLTVAPGGWTPAQITVQVPQEAAPSDTPYDVVVKIDTQSSNSKSFKVTKPFGCTP